MSEQPESLRSKLIVIIVETLIFGTLLAVLGYWLDSRLESTKAELQMQLESTKAVVDALGPLTDQRRVAYLDLRRAAATANSVLRLYFRAPNYEQLDRLRSVENKLGIGSGMGGGAFLLGPQDPINALKEVALLRDTNKDVISALVQAAVDRYIDDASSELEAKSALSNDQSVRAKGIARIQNSFSELNKTLEDALGLAKLPIK
jgi:hypothetical protein